ncbi:MAG TPA: FmdB family transcriptional regulator [Clostridiales bacterium]|jgi:putative FmdB family regulatory protein|nr:FmdB family transcriptional regulator [Clostridiales bacterium]HCG35115.1 FmdB family transcriptional regulator [Clostridiales bacterium]
MPYYDFLCQSCQKESNVQASIEQMSEGKVSCPFCGSEKLEVLFKRPSAVHTKDSGECPHAHTCGGCCHH